MPTPIENLKQLIVEQRMVFRLAGLPKGLLHNSDRLFEVAEAVAGDLNLDVQDRIDHNWTPHGFTGGLILGKSHKIWHTWPEADYMSIDLCTCDPTLDLSRAPVLVLARYNPKFFGYKTVLEPGLSRVRD